MENTFGHIFVKRIFRAIKLRLNRFRGKRRATQTPVKVGSSAKIKPQVGLLAGSVSLRRPKKQHNWGPHRKRVGGVLTALPRWTNSLYLLRLLFSFKQSFSHTFFTPFSPLLSPVYAFRCCISFYVVFIVIFPCSVSFVHPKVPFLFAFSESSLRPFS